MKHHIIYKTTHKNGKYYVGRHSTDDLDDGYIGSGVWPRSLKNKEDVTREILDRARDINHLIELEREYLLENVGKPNCMNMSIDPVGWTSENNPMKNPEIVEKFKGDNHWSHRDPDRYREIFSGIQNALVDDGSHIFIGDTNPNKDGRNAKLAMERGTHINLGENNPAKQWSRNGTHHWQTDEDGTSIGALTNTKRIEEGTHNWQGPEHNKRLIEAGTHNLLGPTQNQKMLAAGTHPSQIKMACIHCGKTVSKGMFTRWHGDNCKLKT